MEFNYQKPDDANALKQFGRNITQDVKDNKIDPIIGREKEIRRLIEIISRKTKNNPVLIGEPGVGKTAIVEGFAARIVAKDVPNNLIGKEVWELSLASLISGASYQGQFEQRLNNVIKQVKASDGRVSGSVSTKQIEDELKKQGIIIDKRKIKDNEPLNELGSYKIKIELYKDVIGIINVKLTEN